MSRVTRCDSDETKCPARPHGDTEMTLNEAIMESGLVLGECGLLTQSRIDAVPAKIWKIIEPHTRLVLNNQSRSESPAVREIYEDVVDDYTRWLAG